MGREQEARKNFSCSASPRSREHKVIKQMLVMSSLMEVYGNLRDLSSARISRFIFLPRLPPQTYKLFPLLAQLYLISMYPL